MSAAWSIARTGLTAIRLHPLRSLVSLLCLLAVLVPYLAVTGLAEGLRRDAEISIDAGADLYVAAERLGLRTPTPLSAVSEIRKIEGIRRVVPRIVGSVRLGLEREPAIVVGLPSTGKLAQRRVVEGRFYRDGPTRELVVGTGLARRLHLRVGSRIPPFYHNDRGERISVVVGTFTSDASLWQSRLILTSFETAAEIFGQVGVAGDLLVYCEPGREAPVREAIQRLFLSGRFGQGLEGQITTRQDLQALLPAGALHKSGIATLHIVLAFVAAGLALLVTSGSGLAERYREIGILKATGWQTDEILLRSLVEGGLISLGAASLALALAWLWLEPLNGFGIAAIFLSGVRWIPSFSVPHSLTPGPALLGLLFSWVVMTAGTLAASWRAAITPPREAMR